VISPHKLLSHCIIFAYLMLPRVTKECNLVLAK